MFISYTCIKEEKAYNHTNILCSDHLVVAVCYFVSSNMYLLP